MPKNAKKIRIQIVNAISGCGHTSLAHARRYITRGQAKWTGDGKLYFYTAADVMAAEGLSPVPVWVAGWRNSEAAVLAFEGRKAA